MTEQPVTLAQQATEAELAALEWAGWMRQIAQSKDNRVDSSVERLASMSMRLKVKQAIAETMMELAEREARRAARDAGRAA